eukprot:13257820-Alexandrium_andersonii.AAC.1
MFVLFFFLRASRASRPPVSISIISDIRVIRLLACLKSVSHSSGGPRRLRRASAHAWQAGNPLVADQLVHS